MGEAPGVDGLVHFTSAAEVGSFVDVRLGGATAFDFYGTLATDPVRELAAVG
jgi:hypothetical protein